MHGDSGIHGTQAGSLCSSLAFKSGLTGRCPTDGVFNPCIEMQDRKKHHLLTYSLAEIQKAFPFPAVRCGAEVHRLDFYLLDETLLLGVGGVLTGSFNARIPRRDSEIR